MAKLILTPWQAAARAGMTWAMGNASADIDTGDTIIIVRNDNEVRPFFIYSVTAGTEDKGEIVIHRVTAAYTAAGTSITAVNMSDVNAEASELTVHGDETGNSQGDIITKFGLSSAAANEERASREVIYDGGLILQPGHALGVDIVGEPELCFASILGWFEIEDAS